MPVFTHTSHVQTRGKYCCRTFYLWQQTFRLRLCTDRKRDSSWWCFFVLKVEASWRWPGECFEPHWQEAKDGNIGKTHHKFSRKTLTQMWLAPIVFPLGFRVQWQKHSWNDTQSVETMRPKLATQINKMNSRSVTFDVALSKLLSWAWVQFCWLTCASVPFTGKIQAWLG